MCSFPLEQDEVIIKKGYATFSCDDISKSRQLHINTMEGMLYLTTIRLVFVGRFLATTTQYMEEVPLVHIDQMIPEKSLFILSNVIRIITIRNKELMLVVRHRDEWMAAIKKQASLL